jgi:rhomboid family GlyGly-CTERM serine protease
MSAPLIKAIRSPWAIAGIAALASAGLTWLPLHPVAAFGWLRTAPASEAWRCLTCHFVHLGGRHLMFNLAALAGLAGVAHLHGRQVRVETGFAGALLAGMLGVCLGLRLNDAGVAWYAGLSGALFGVYAWLALDMAALRHWQGRAAWVLYLCGLAKALADAQTAVGTPGLSGIPLAPPAHLYGLLGGTLWAGLRYALRLRRERRASMPRPNRPS